jgi:hypothetical protein
VHGSVHQVFGEMLDFFFGGDEMLDLCYAHLFQLCKMWWLWLVSCVIIPTVLLSEHIMLLTLKR